MIGELVKPPFTRYYLRMQRGGLSQANDTEERANAYIDAHDQISGLPYILVLNPRMIDLRNPQCTSNHHPMFVSIMEKREEEFEKELFKLSLSIGTIEIAKKETIQYLRSPDVKEW